METRQITPRYFVSPQINPEDLATLKAAGFTKVICNRPDEEIPASHHADVMAQAAQAAGLEFFALPLTHQTMTPQNIAAQMEAVEAASGPVLAYCASGTRCSVIWALSQAGQMPVDDILTTALRAGYDLSGLRPRLEQG